MISKLVSKAKVIAKMSETRSKLGQAQHSWVWVKLSFLAEILGIVWNLLGYFGSSHISLTRVHSCWYWCNLHFEGVGWGIRVHQTLFASKFEKGGVIHHKEMTIQKIFPNLLAGQKFLLKYKGFCQKYKGKFGFSHFWRFVQFFSWKINLNCIDQFVWSIRFIWYPYCHTLCNFMPYGIWHEMP